MIHLSFIYSCSFNLVFLFSLNKSTRTNFGLLFSTSDDFGDGNDVVAAAYVDFIVIS